MRQLRPREITFEPMDKKQSEFFRVSEICPPEHHKYPAIPMGHAALSDLEEETSFMCEEFVLRFKSPDGTEFSQQEELFLFSLTETIPDAFAFYNLYRKEKGIWLEESKGQPARNNAGSPSPGPRKHQ